MKPQPIVQVQCGQCSWSATTPSQDDLLAVARAAREFESHLVAVHGAPRDEAEAAADAWALQTVRDQIR